MRRMQEPVSVVAESYPSGRVVPLRFRMSKAGRGPEGVVIIDRIIGHTRDQQAGQRLAIFECQTCYHHHLRRFELQLNMDKIQWYLTKW